MFERLVLLYAAKNNVTYCDLETFKAYRQFLQCYNAHFVVILFMIDILPLELKLRK